MKWCDRALVVSPYYYGLCRSEKEFRRELKRMRLPREHWPSFLKTASADATSHFFEHGDGRLIAIVCLGSVKGLSREQVYGLLVHEAMHIWQQVRGHLGEGSPSSEFEAYAVQGISQMLMQAYVEGKKA